VPFSAYIPSTATAGDVMGQNDTPEELLKKYQEGTASEAEKAIVESWHLSDLAQSDFVPAQEAIENTHTRMRSAVAGHARQSAKVRTLWPRIAAVALILLGLSFGLYRYLHKGLSVNEYANDIAPGTGKPFITLANGRKVLLGSQRGAIARLGGIIIHKNAAGRVVYDGDDATATGSNTLTNPRGGAVLSLLLPDGTLAELDAASSITYPLAFRSGTRSVSTAGRVYFEVKHNDRQPFQVITDGQITRDIGTHFIVEAYNDEPAIKTTLTEGRISVNNSPVKPGEQTLLQNNKMTVREADLDEETAWIKGDLDFHNQDLATIMRELSRAYNIDVSYEGGTRSLLFDGMISRSRNLSAVLDMMAGTGKIHFKIEGRRVMVIAGPKS
jgi:transmembrane sensor